MSEMRILLTGGVGEYEEKKSRFIATLRPVSTPEEAASFFDEMKKKYWDARHNCSACVIGKNNEYSRCSDDGEPSGTAGRPMLEVLIGSEVHNAAVVVTRYFGGVLLGTGGLVRAYTKVVQEGLNNSTLAIEREGVRILLAMDYPDVDRVLNLLKNKGQSIDKSDYGTDVNMEIVCAVEKKDDLTKALTELTAGRIIIEELGACSFLNPDTNKSF